MQPDPTTTSRLIIKFLSNELNAQEQEEFERWLSADPANRELLESFRNTSQVQQEINYLDTVDQHAGWAAVKGRIQEKQSPKLFKTPWLKYAAAAMLVLSSGIGLYYYRAEEAKLPQQDQTAGKQDVMPGQSRAVLQLADGSSVNLPVGGLELNGKDHSKINTKGDVALHVPKAGEYKMTLPDGTKVWLNAASTLKFPASFNQSERRVQLEGEAYFEVAPDKKHPFIVIFNDTQVEVLGTHFNIQTYGASSKTTLIEGSVKVSSLRGVPHETSSGLAVRQPHTSNEIASTSRNEEIVLKPGQQALAQDGELTVKESDIQKSIAWKDGLFYFKEDRIDDILNQISRWYDVEIVYTSQPNQKRYDGTIRRQATLSQVLDMLNTVSGTDFTIKDKTIIVSFND